MPLHLTKVAFGCRTIEAVQRKVERWSRDGEMRVPTRMRPKRAAECIGGYLHYIVKHRIVARIPILRFEDRKDGRIDIVCSDQVELVTATPRRAHQGWRYLEDEEAPGTGFDETGIGELPPRLYGKLSGLGLV